MEDDGKPRATQAPLHSVVQVREVGPAAQLPQTEELRTRAPSWQVKPLWDPDDLQSPGPSLSSCVNTGGPDYWLKTDRNFLTSEIMARA